MAYRQYLHVWFMILLGIAMTSGCSDNTLSSGANGKPATATVHVRSGNGSPLESVTVTMKNTFKKAKTDSTGSVFFDNIQPGRYEIGITREDIPLCWRHYMLEGGRHKDISMTVASRLDVRVTIRDKQGPPLTNATVTITGTDNKSTTGDNGECTFTNVVMGNLAFNVKCPEFSVKSNKVYTDQLSNDDNQLKMSIAVDIPPPEISLNSPVEERLNYIDMSLSCEAVDAFGQPVPDSLIVWEEVRFGEIGRGRSIESPPFKVGFWSLSVSATDTYGYQNKITNNCYVYYYNPESYFPMPTTGYWQYTYDNREIVIAYENYTELLVFSDIRVTMLDENRMETTVGYEIHTADDIDYAEYTVTDLFKASRDSLLVESTREVLNRWEVQPGENYTQVDSWIKSHTTYSSLLLYMCDTVSPQPGEVHNTTCTAEVDRILFDGFLTRSFTYHLPVTTTCTIGDVETVTVHGESYETVPVIIQQGETVKRWWLARSTGIVRMEHPLNGTPLRADLTDMSIGTSSPEIMPSHTTLKRTPFTHTPVRHTVKASATGIEAHLNLLRTLIQ